jgi:hypothetical protein
MRSQSDGTWKSWMDAEARRDDAAAEAAVGTALRAVGRRAPSADLSARLMVAASAKPVPAAARRSERAIAAGLVALAFAMTLLPAVLIAVLFVADAGRVVSAVARVCVWIIDWLNAGVSVWGVLARTGRVLDSVASTPAASAGLTGALLIASSAVLALNRYLTEERS